MRAAVSSFVVAAVVYIVLKITYRIWRPILLSIRTFFNKTWFFLMGTLYYDRKMKNAHAVSYADTCGKYNRFCETTEGRVNKIHTMREEAKRHGFRFKWLLVIYFAAAVSVLGPAFLEMDLDKPLSYVLVRYLAVETEGLRIARLRQPPAALPKQTEEETEQEQKTMYCLNENGRNGSNLRKEPGKSAQVVTVLEGDVVMEYIETQEFKGSVWVHIKLENGTEGWISGKLIQEMEQ